MAQASFGDTLDLANAADESKTLESSEIFGLANDLQVDDQGWATVPYGNSRHNGRDGTDPKKSAPKGIIQRLTREDAQAVVDDFKSTWSRIKRAVVGLPIYKGHPDAPAFANLYPDKTPRGTIANMAVGDQGLRMQFVLTNAGATEVEAGVNQFSPFWSCRKVGESPDGAIIAAPFKLFSVGIWPRGNIPGLSLVNAAQADQPESDKTMKATLLKLLAVLGKTQSADAGDDVVIAAANAAETEITSLLKAKTDLDAATTAKAALEATNATLAGEKLALANTKVELEGKFTAAEQRATKAEGDLKVARREHGLHLVNAAVQRGAVTLAEKDAELTNLCNAADFTAAAAALAAKPKKIQTTSRAAGLASAATTSAPRGQQFIDLVNARMESDGIDYDAAWAAVSNSENGKALLAAMKPQA